jgi:hypothetical protein
VAVMKVREEVSFGFDETPVDLQLVGNLDHLNFRELPPGTRLGWLKDDAQVALHVHDDNGQEVYEEYFSVDEGALVTTRPFMPSMLTLDERIIRQDCLGYLMEKLLPE